jgi:hypothetical protein
VGVLVNVEVVADQNNWPWLSKLEALYKILAHRICIMIFSVFESPTRKESTVIVLARR